MMKKVVALMIAGVVFVGGCGSATKTAEAPTPAETEVVEIVETEVVAERPAIDRDAEAQAVIDDLNGDNNKKQWVMLPFDGTNVPIYIFDETQMKMYGNLANSDGTAVAGAMLKGRCQLVAWAANEFSYIYNREVIMGGIMNPNGDLMLVITNDGDVYNADTEKFLCNVYDD